MSWLELNTIALVASGILFLAAFLSYFFLLAFKYRSIFEVFKRTPPWLIAFNGAILVYKLFFIDFVFCGRQEFGVWILGMAKIQTPWEALFSERSPVYFFIIKLLSFIADGVGLVFIEHFNAVLSFLSAFFVYWIVRQLFRDKTAAGFAAVLYALSPILFIFSLTEDYTNPALFFALQALFFVCLYIRQPKQDSFLLLAIVSSVLAVGSRPEYIFFDFLFVLFLVLFLHSIKKKHLLIYGVFLIPKLTVAILMYLKAGMYDAALHGKTFTMSNGLFVYIMQLISHHWHLFWQNLEGNIQAVTNLNTLAGAYLLLALFAYFWYRQTGSERGGKRGVLFFAVFLTAFFLYYSYLHKDGVMKTFKYISTLIVPLSVLAGLGLSYLSAKPKIRYLALAVVLVMAGYSLYVTSPATHAHFGDLRDSQDASFNYYFERPPALESEFRKYNSLSFRNRYDRLLGVRQDSDIDLGRDNIFISNGHMSMLFSVPVSQHVEIVRNAGDFYEILPVKADNIYVSQGLIGFKEMNLGSGFRHMSADHFEQMVNKHFQIEEKLVSFRENGHHVFLYKCSPE